MLYVCVRGVMNVVFFCLYCDALSCMCSCMGSMSVFSCRCYMFVSCVHPVTVAPLFGETIRNMFWCG